MSVQWDPKWTRAEMMCRGPQTGTNWRIETAESAFEQNADGSPRRFQYIALEQISPPWAGIDDVQVERGWRTRESLAKEAEHGR